MSAEAIEVVEHPAKFSTPILNAVDGIVAAESIRQGRALSILDPFAGVGGIHRLHESIHDFGRHYTVGVELEPEWACQHPRNIVGDSLALAETLEDANEPGLYDAIITSPCYGNRMADCHDAKDPSKRHTYRHTLGRMPQARSSATLQWGPAYRAFHEAAIRQWWRVLDPTGARLVVVNASNHVRNGDEQKVAEWWTNELLVQGCRLWEVRRVGTRRQRHGANAAARVDGELIIVVHR